MRGTGERTVLPPAKADELLGLLRALDVQGNASALITRDGSRIDLPDELYDVLHDVVYALSRGLAITVAPRHTVLTTGEAAELLGVSRPTLVRLLESGEIPYEQPGRHRRIRLDDLLAYENALDGPAQRGWTRWSACRRKRGFTRYLQTHTSSG
ncbi:DNA binding domain-containing protein, excisionase family [Saccharopolyspora kobensis]|uniref:DNA binding domain-containing protein, excisionase family n=1 Tax=Saccharopolyspora kobensis TaxID=146035 RepID=A0A1H6BTZ3_9PSEU|nr:excisionase family DNA-binding protein [Saccharopolyspora kobensis]SEG64174.1 DNA binding domain-containing protein, excisionase family [Saccharopolyspora kobensis]SFC16231.1 DNA binding domain-containing protein, excisionase family [Saccharopolyspora kobensis]